MTEKKYKVPKSIRNREDGFVNVVSKRRLKSGYYEIHHRPLALDNKSIKTSIKGTKDLIRFIRAKKKKDFRCYCPLCRTSYDIPSVMSNIEKNGICSWCSLYMDGHVESVKTTIPPSLEQVKKRIEDGFGLTSAEIIVLYSEYKEKVDECKSLEEEVASLRRERMWRGMENED